MTRIIQQARRDDFEEIKNLLSNANLPTEDLNEDLLRNFLTLKIENVIIGCVGLEIFDEFALLRSLVVQKEHSGKGYAGTLVEEIENWARSNNVIALYLLTDTAAVFFEKHDYVNIQRDAAPASIKDSKQFSVICGSSALSYVKTL